MVGETRNTLPKDSSGWAKLLLSQQLPALSKTAQAISDCAAKDSSSCTQLASLVLRDAGMTTKVLRLASSRLYNPHGLRIRTVSRAVALLGFNVVCEIALGVAVLEALGGGRTRCAQAAAEAAHALRAAVQARGLAELAKLPDSEEVFIAGLLQGLGRLAFWSAVPSLLPEWASNAAESSVLARSRVRQRIDLDLDDLSLLLNAELRLSPVLLADDDPPGKAAARFAHRWVDALSAGGSPADFEAALAEAAVRFDISTEALHDCALAHAEQADTLIEQLFDPETRALLPATRAVGAPLSPDDAKPSRNDPFLAREVLRDLGELLASSRPDPGVALSMVMEGMTRAAGMDRVLFVLLSPDRSELRLRSALGGTRQPVSAAFPLPTNDCGRLLDLLADAKTQRLGGEGASETGRFLARLSTRGALIHPLVVGGRPRRKRRGNRCGGRESVRPAGAAGECGFGDGAVEVAAGGKTWLWCVSIPEIPQRQDGRPESCRNLPRCATNGPSTRTAASGCSALAG